MSTFPPACPQNVPATFTAHGFPVRLCRCPTLTCHLWLRKSIRLFAFAFHSMTHPAETCHPVPPVSGFPTLCSRSLLRRVLDGSATICVSALRPIPNSGHSIRVQLLSDFPFVSFVWLFANYSHLWRVLQGLYLSL